MILHHKLKACYITEKEYASLSKLLRYGSTEKGIKAIKTFLDSGSITDWLDLSLYDFHYGAEDFVRALAAILGVDVDKELDIIQVRRQRRDKLLQLKIKVNNDWKRPPHRGSMAFMGFNKYAFVDFDAVLLLDKSDDDVLASIADIVEAHYDAHCKDKPTPYPGNITHYSVEYIDGKTHRFTPKALVDTMKPVVLKRDTILQNLQVSTDLEKIHDTEEKKICQKWADILEHPEASDVALGIQDVERVLREKDEVHLFAFEAIVYESITHTISTTLQAHVSDVYAKDILIHITLRENANVNDIASQWTSLSDKFDGDSFIVGIKTSKKIWGGEVGVLVMV